MNLTNIMFSETRHKHVCTKNKMIVLCDSIVIKCKRGQNGGNF